VLYDNCVILCEFLYEIFSLMNYSNSMNAVVFCSIYRIFMGYFMHLSGDDCKYCLQGAEGTNAKVFDWANVGSLWQISLIPHLYSPDGSIGLTVWLPF